MLKYIVEKMITKMTEDKLRKLHEVGDTQKWM